MSLTELYNNAKLNRPQSEEKVFYSAEGRVLKDQLDTVNHRIQALTTEIRKLEETVKVLESADLKNYNEKHARIKENYNNLVASYNQNQAELQTVIMDVSKRLNDMESKL